MKTGRPSIAWLIGAVLFFAAGSPRAQSPTTPTVLFPWLALSTTQPLNFQWSHKLVYNPVTRGVQIDRSNWQLPRMTVAAFGGETSVSGTGRVEKGKPVDISTSLTLRRVDIQAFLKFLNVPQANQIEARVTGMVAAQIAAGDFKEFVIQARTEPGSVRLHRNLLKQILGVALGNGDDAKKVDDVLNAFFGSAMMIPIESMTIEGSLGKNKLNIKMPIRNQALNIDFEPQIDAGLLWEAWGFAKDAGLKNTKGIEWKK